MKRTQVLKFLGFSAVFLFTSMFFGFNLVRYYEVNKPPSLPAVASATDVIVIDAGHGGEDGGATSADGITEKDVNLAEAEALAALFRFAGYNAVETRTTDTMLYDKYGDAVRGMKKAYDLKNRLRFADEANATLFISLHCNKFPEAKYHGMQVFYSTTDGSQAIAESIKTVNKAYRETDSNREAKKATSAIYLLSHAKIPSVLVECGFLSNDGDKATLTSTEGRRDIAVTVFAGVVMSGRT